MKTWFLFSVMAYLTFLTRPIFAADTSAASGYRNVRVLNEFDLIDFAKIDASNEDWAVIRVAQGPSIPENDISNEARGRAREGTFICDLVNATATPVATLRGTVADGSWSCFAPVPARILFGTVPTFMIDRETGPCICRVNKNIPGANRTVLEESKLIPDAWVEEVKPAYDAWRANREIFTGTVEGERQQKLVEMSKDKNHVTSFMAYRRLAETGHLTFKDVPSELLEARNEFGMLVLLHVLHDTPQPQQDDLYERLVKQVDSAKTLEELHGIATVCSLELGMRSRVHVDNRSSYKLLTRIEARIDELSKDGKVDEYFDAATQEWRLHKF